MSFWAVGSFRENGRMASLEKKSICVCQCSRLIRLLDAGFSTAFFPPPAGCVQTDTLARIHASANCNRRIRQDVRVALRTRAGESRSNRSWLPSTLRIWLHVRRGRWPACNVVAYFPERKAREILCTGASRRRRPPTAIGFFCSRALALFLRIWFCAQLRL